jgi:hypothetical protein
LNQRPLAYQASALTELSYRPSFNIFINGKLTGMWILAFVAFIIAAFLALAGISGITLTQIVGIIAIGLAFLALDATGWGPAWAPRGSRRRV